MKERIKKLLHALLKCKFEIVEALRIDDELFAWERCKECSRMRYVEYID